MPSTLVTLMGQKSMCLKSDMVLVWWCCWCWRRWTSWGTLRAGVGVVGDLGGFVELVTCVTLETETGSWWIRDALKMGVILNKWATLVCGKDERTFVG